MFSSGWFCRNAALIGIQDWKKPEIDFQNHALEWLNWIRSNLIAIDCHAWYANILESNYLIIITAIMLLSISTPFRWSLKKKKQMEAELKDCEKVSAGNWSKRKWYICFVCLAFACLSCLFCFGVKQMGCRKRSEMTWYAGHLFKPTILFIYLCKISPDVCNHSSALFQFSLNFKV